MPLFDYRCKDGHVTEALRSRSVTAIDCPCGGVAQRQLSTFSVMTATQMPQQRREPRSYREDFRRYQEAVEELERPFAEREQLEGAAIPRPPLARTALKSARALQRAGVTSADA